MPKRSEPEQQAAAMVAQPPSRAVALAEQVAVLDHDLQAKSEALANALAGTYDPRYFMSVALSQFRRSPSLYEVPTTVQGRVSFVDAVVQAAQYGLPFLAGRAYLVPFRNKGVAEAQLIVGYQGLVDLVTAPGTGVTYVEAAVVYEADEFAYRKGTDAFLRHVPWRTAGEDGVVDRGRATDVWAQVVYASGQSRFEVFNITEVEAIRRRSKAGQSGPWVTDWGEMAKKTVLRNLCKTLRISLRVMEMLEREDEAERTPEQAPGVSQQGRLRQQIAQRVARGDAPEAEAVQATPEVLHEALQQAEEAVLQPDGDYRTPEEQAAFVADTDSSLDAAEAAAVDEPVEALWADAPPAADPVEPATSAAVTCGATVEGGEGVVACHLAPGHRGLHSDGLHDWPNTK